VRFVMIRVATVVAATLFGGARDGFAEPLISDRGSALVPPQPSQARKEDAGNASDRPLRVTIRPTRPWESFVAPLADDPLQRAPASTNVYDETTIRDARIEDVEDIAAATPGLQMSGLTNRMTLRGVGDMVLFTTAQSPVGLYIDDVYVPNPAAFNFDLFDIERIEILRGPQGFRGGRGSIAGDVRIRTIGAKPENSGAVEATLGSFDQRQVRTSLNATTKDKAASNRLAANYLARDGTVLNRTTGEYINTRRNWGVRDQVAFGTRPGVTADLSLDFANYRPVRPATGGFDSVLDGEVTIFNPTREEKQLYGGALRINGAKDQFDIASITAVRGLQYETLGSDASAANLVDQGVDQSQHYASQELRFSSKYRNKADWIAGTYFYGQKTDQEALVRFNNAAAGLGLPFGHSETSLADQELWSAAAFGETTWHVSSRFDVIAGLRASYDRQSIDYRYVSNDGVAILAPLQTRREAAGYTGLFWKLGTSYAVAPGVAPYATIGRGSKPGGFNTTQLPSSGGGFEKETATNYEIGLKSAWLGGSLVANAAAFYLHRKDQQVQNIGAYSAPTINAKESRSRGFELTLAGRPNAGLDLQFNYAYVDAAFVDFANFPKTGGGTLDLSGRDIPFASSHSLSAALNFVRPLTEATRFVFRTDVSYRSAFYFDAVNSLEQPGYGLWNAHAGLRGGDWGLFVWGKNLSDTSYRVSAATTSTSRQAIAGDPRTLGVEFRYQF